MKFLPLFYWAIKELLMLQWFDIDKDWGEVRKSIECFCQKITEEEVYIYQNVKVEYWF